MAYERITGPLGPAREDLQAGIVASTVYNVNRGKGQRAAKPSDFIAKFDRQERSPEELWRLAMAANSAAGGTVRTDK